jgi:NodT family efflux transporter outer membrane factor (OMF) lipoprotein
MKFAGKGRPTLPVALRASIGLLPVVLAVGCLTGPKQYLRQGFKLGPNYRPPAVSLAPEWATADPPQVVSGACCDPAWWSTFRDPELDRLVATAYQQNLSLAQASSRVMQAQAQRAIAVGGLFPQQQQVLAEHQQVHTSAQAANPWPHLAYSNWLVGLTASWELDFWGRLRRQVESADARLSASVEDYRQAMVTLSADTASAYVQLRVIQQRLACAEENVRIQCGSADIAQLRFQHGAANELDVRQARALLEQTRARIPLLAISRQQANNQLCVLLGLPPTELARRLKPAPIPQAAPEVLVGVPADLLRRRPDLRAAERRIAAQSAQIGVAEAELYPAFFLNGSIGLNAEDLSLLSAGGSGAYQIGPSVRWNILNYGRIQNQVLLQDYRTQELIASYRQQVLMAAQEVENGIAAFLHSRQQAIHLQAAVAENQRAVELIVEQYRQGATDYNQVLNLQALLVQQQDQLAVARGNVVLGVIGVYRALGGGWEACATDVSSGAVNDARAF